jgi:anti-sigma factor RsiW
VNACTAQPISWMRLERYALGEFSDGERSDIASHLAQCPACSACMKRIAADATRELPTLPRRVVEQPKRGARPWRTIWAGAGFVSAAAAILLVFGGPGTEPPSRRHVKGGDFALDLVRIDAGDRLQPATHFGRGDRFKVLVTCPTGWRGVAGVSVYQSGKVHLTLPASWLDECGNRRALEGAFSLDGRDRALVCVSFAGDAATWGEQVRSSEPPDGSVCVALEPTPDEAR